MNGTGFIEKMCGIFGGLSIIISIILFMFLGIPSARKMNRNYMVTAEIVDYIDESVREHSSRGTYEKVMYCPVYGYTYDGDYYETRSDNSTSFTKPIGTDVDFYVDPDDPAKGSEKTSLVIMAFIPIFVLFLGLFFFLVSVFGRIGRNHSTSNRYLLRISGIRTMGIIFVVI